MKIWFGTTTLKYKEYKDNYFAIRNYILELGHVLTDDWLLSHGEWIEKNPTKERNIKDVYQKTMHAVEAADASVIEFTVPNFSSSHQLTHSIYLKKPTLVMRMKKDNTFADSYIDGIVSPYLFVKDYTLKNYKEILEEFFGYSKLEQGNQRYNIVLDRKHKHYLDWANLKHKKSRSLLIREALEDKMLADPQYKNYVMYN